jgi:ribonuclease PH
MSERLYQRVHDRAIDGLRPTTLELGVMKYAEGSALIKVGDTHVLAAASVENRVPPFMKDSGAGWITAEYAMLPRATETRSQREVKRGHPSGRSSEIQRLIGRSLRAAVDFEALGERTITIDCDVLQADGGTRTAAITAGYAALVQALGRTYLTGDLVRWPLVQQIAAVSVGIVSGQALLDLEYCEDRDAAVDMNIVATGSGKLVEIQGTAEEDTFDRDELNTLLDLAFQGVGQLCALQNQALEPVMEEVDAVRNKGSRRPAPAKDERDLWGPPG